MELENLDIIGLVRSMGPPDQLATIIKAAPVSTDTVPERKEDGYETD